MKLGQMVWGTLFLVLGVLAAGGWFPGASTASPGPRFAMAGLLLTLGALTIGIPLTQWLILKTTRPEDYEGTCPVGRVCPDCGAFTFYPKNRCKSCNRDLGAVPTTGSKTEPL